MRKKLYFFYLFTIFLTQSCSKEEVTPTPNPTPTPTPPQITLTLPKISLSTNALVTDISPFQGKLFYIVSDYGGTKINENGICWSTNSNPTVNDKKNIDSLPLSVSTSILGVMSNLLPKTKYYVRAFATNSVGTSYSNELSFITDTLYGCSVNPTLFKGELFAQQLTDGKILISSANGSSNELNNKPINGIVKLNTDGTIDNTFNYNQNYNFVGILRGKFKILVQKDGKYIACYNANNGYTKFIRINTNGTVDNTFNPSITASSVFDMEIQNDDKILLGGTQINGGKLVRLNNNGSLDTTFVVKGVSIGTVSAISISNDGKILLCSGGSLLRLNSDGTYDNSFKTTSNISVNHIVKTLSNKFLIQYHEYNSTNSYIISLNSDGSKDETFKSITINDLNVRHISNIQSDNYIYISGQFSKLNNENYNSFARFNSDGIIDKTLNIGTGFTNSGVVIGNKFALTTGFLSNDKKIVVSGGFDNYDGKKVKYFSKINYDGSICQ